MLKLNGFSFQYDKPIFHNLNFSLQQGERAVLLGPSGIGKTTLLRSICGYLKAEGSALWNDVPIQPSTEAVSLLFQEHSLFPWYTLFENVELPLKIKKINKTQRKSRVEKELAHLGIKKISKKYPHQLSGGERQRASFARLLVNKPQLLLLDEPFQALDALTRERMQNLLLDLALEEKLSFFMVTHSIDEAVFLADKIFFLEPEGAIFQANDFRLDQFVSRTDSAYSEAVRKIRKRFEEFYETDN